MIQNIRVIFLLIFLFGSGIFFFPLSGRTEAIDVEKLNYLEISGPDYPKVARAKGWEGTVVLKALVEKDGHCESAVVEKSSGHKVLDESAIEAVKRWKFSPARMGNESYAAITRVPVQFILTDKS